MPTAGLARVATATLRGVAAPSARLAPVRTVRDHAIDLFAGFFASEDAARLALSRLDPLALEGLTRRGRIDVLGPQHAGWRTFRQLSRNWSPARDAQQMPWYAQPPLAAMLGGLLALVLGAAGSVLDIGLWNDWSTEVLLFLPVVGTGLGWAAASWIPQLTPHARFSHSVRRQLLGGRWAVLAHQVPWSQQNAVFGPLQVVAEDWCEAGARHYVL
jgi:hypothetical protein